MGVFSRSEESAIAEDEMDCVETPEATMDGIDTDALMHRVIAEALKPVITELSVISTVIDSAGEPSSLVALSPEDV